MSAPIILPTANSPCPRLTAVIAVTSSGSEVPNATNVNDMIDSGTLNLIARTLTAGMRICAEITTTAIEPISLRSVRSEFELSSSVG